MFRAQSASESAALSMIIKLSTFTKQFQLPINLCTSQSKMLEMIFKFANNFQSKNLYCCLLIFIRKIITMPLHKGRESIIMIRKMFLPLFLLINTVNASDVGTSIIEQEGKDGAFCLKKSGLSFLKKLDIYRLKLTTEERKVFDSWDEKNIYIGLNRDWKVIGVSREFVSEGESLDDKFKEFKACCDEILHAEPEFQVERGRITGGVTLTVYKNDTFRSFPIPFTKSRDGQKNLWWSESLNKLIYPLRIGLAGDPYSGMKLLKRS